MELLPLLRPYVDVIEDGQLGQAVHEEASVSGDESQGVPLEHQDVEVLQSGQLGDQLQQVREAVKAQVKRDKVWPEGRTQGRRLGSQHPFEDRKLQPWGKNRNKNHNSPAQTGLNGGTQSGGQFQIPEPDSALPVCPKTEKHFFSIH